ncbi:MAG TPA: hypothetical protein VM120_03320, partial [Bryobacteraceae bacterium]|nr:hypothetical protein [Bryobacteraceae bacterium]
TSIVLVDGKPPLTDSLLNSYFDYVEWASGRKTTVAERREAREIFTSYWQSALRDKQSLAGLAENLTQLGDAAYARQGDPNWRPSTVRTWIQFLQGAASNPLGVRHLKWFLQVCGNCAAVSGPAPTGVQIPTILFAHDGAFGKAQGSFSLTFTLQPNGLYCGGPLS